jgi:hypothetical protein
MSKSTPAEPDEQLLYNHHLQEFLRPLSNKRERFCRRHDCQPRTSAETLSGLAYCAARAVVHGVADNNHLVLHPCRGRQVEARTSLSPSLHPGFYTYENLPQGPSWDEVKELVTSVQGPSPASRKSPALSLAVAHTSNAAANLVSSSTHGYALC